MFEKIMEKKKCNHCGKMNEYDFSRITINLDDPTIREQLRSGLKEIAKIFEDPK